MHSGELRHVDKAEGISTKVAHYRRRVTLSTAMLNLAVVSQWANLLVIPALYDDLGASFGWSTSQLGLIQTITSFSMFASLPFFGYMSSKIDRRIIIATSTVAATILTGLHIICTTYEGFLLVSVFSGISLGAVIPVGRSLIPTYYVLEKRGTYYGLFELSAGIGGLLGAATGVVCSSISTSFLSNWQLAYFVLTVLMIPVGPLFYFLVIDVNMDGASIRKDLGPEFNLAFPGGASAESVKGMVARDDLKSLLSSKTFIALLFQGATGAFPWAQLSFLILWFTKMGIGSPMNLLIYASVGGGAAAGGALGGMLGDYMMVHVSRKYGRIIVAQTSVCISIPMSCILFLAIPQTASSWYIYFLCGLIFGMSISWCPGNNSANLSDIFEDKILPSAFGVSYFVEGCVSSWSPACVGYVAQYIFNANLSNFDTLSPPEQKDALFNFAMAPLAICIIAWGLCAMTYIPMYIYYPKESRELNPGKTLSAPKAKSSVAKETKISDLQIVEIPSEVKPAVVAHYKEAEIQQAESGHQQADTHQGNMTEAP